MSDSICFCSVLVVSYNVSSQSYLLKVKYTEFLNFSMFILIQDGKCFCNNTPVNVEHNQLQKR